MIPKRLRDPEFRFIKLQPNGKNPVAGESWKSNLLKFNDPKLLEHIKNGGNIGWVASFGDVRFIDIDQAGKEQGLHKKLIPRLNTLVLETGSGNYHLPVKTSYSQNHRFKGNVGEYRADGQYIVVAPSVHPKTNKRYKVFSDIPIATIAAEEMDEILKPIRIGSRKSGKTVKTKFKGALRTISDSTDHLIRNGREEKNSSRNEGAWIVCKELFKRGFTEEEIIKHVLQFNKNCKPKKPESVARAHVVYLLQHSDRYLVEEVDEKWLKKDDYGSIEKRIESRVCLSGDELSKLNYPPIEWIIPNWIPRKGIVLIAGTSKSWKSLWIMKMTMSISEGADFYGLKTKKSRVLFFDAEVGIQALIERKEKLEKAMGITKLNNWFLDSAKVNQYKAMRIDTDDGFKTLCMTIEKYKPDVLVLDVARRFHSKKEDRADEVNALYLDAFQPIIDKYDILLILIAHSKKPPSDKKNYDAGDPYNIRGSSEMPNISDVVIMLERIKREYPFLRVHHSMSRHSFEQPKMVFEFVFDKEKMSFVKRKEEYVESVLKSAEIKGLQEAIDYAKEVKEFKTKDFKDELSLLNVEADRILKRMIKFGIIEKKRRGYWQLVERTDADLPSFVKRDDDFV